jgi:hypothetical protein
MKWNDVSAFAVTWAEQHGLPVKLKGQWLELVDFDTEEDCRFFYPERDLLSHRAFLNALARLAQGRGARTRRVRISPDHYRPWLDAEHHEDTRERRSSFIESRYRTMS